MVSGPARRHLGASEARWYTPFTAYPRRWLRHWAQSHGVRRPRRGGRDRLLGGRGGILPEKGLSRVRQGTLEELAFPDRQFDLIFATDVIEHLDDDRQALSEFRRVAAPGARLVITVPAYMWLWSRHDVSMHHRRRYTAGRLHAALAAAGWQPVVRSYFYSALLPAVAAVRVAQAPPGSKRALRSATSLRPP